VKPTKRTLPSRFARSSALDDAAAREVTIGIVVVGAFVHLPQVEMVGLQPPERVFELAHRDLRIPSVGADLGHQEHAIATISDRGAHPDLAFVLVVFPRVVEESHARVNRSVHHANALAGGLDAAQVIPAKRECRNGHVGVAPERTKRNHGAARSKLEAALVVASLLVSTDTGADSRRSLSAERPRLCSGSGRAGWR
jgi:hypothetical protein